MAALRWFLFALFAFGGGAVAAFTLHPPALGIPEADAANLNSRLAKIEQYAGEGRCEAVKGQLSGAQSTVDKLPSNVNVTIQRQLEQAVVKVRREALSTCLKVAAAKTTLHSEATATTPAPTPEPTLRATPEPQTTSPDGGAPDTGTGEGATPAPDSTSPNGGATLPEGDAGAALQQGLDSARERYRRAQEEIQRELDQLNGAFSG